MTGDPPNLCGLQFLPEDSTLELQAGPGQAHLGAQATPTPAALQPFVHRYYSPPPASDLQITTLYYESRDEYVQITHGG
jgi:hypothetical protein